MLRLAARFRSKWVDIPAAFLCSSASLEQLLRAPEHAEWLNLSASVSEATRFYKFSTRAAVHSPALEADSAHLRGRPRPVALCPEACGGTG